MQIKIGSFLYIKPHIVIFSFYNNRHPMMDRLYDFVGLCGDRSFRCPTTMICTHGPIQALPALERLTAYRAPCRSPWLADCILMKILRFGILLGYYGFHIRKGCAPGFRRNATEAGGQGKPDRVSPPEE